MLPAAGWNSDILRNADCDVTAPGSFRDEDARHAASFQSSSRRFQHVHTGLLRRRGFITTRPCESEGVRGQVGEPIVHSLPGRIQEIAKSLCVRDESD